MGWRGWFRRQPEQVTVDGELLEGDELVAVVGESNYQDANEKETLHGALGVEKDMYGVAFRFVPHIEREW